MRYIQVILFAFIYSISEARACPTIVSSQEQFDAIIERINKGAAINIKLNKGRYILKKSVVAKSPVKIVGDEAVITFTSICFNSEKSDNKNGTHYIYNLKTPLSPYAMFYNQHGELIYVSETVLKNERVNYVEGIIDVPNNSFEAGTRIKIPISTNLSHLKSKTFNSAFGYFDNGWRVINFRLESSDNKNFYCTTLNKCDTQNFMYDYQVYKKPVRYVLYNVEITPGYIYYEDKKLYVPKGVDKLYCLNSKDLGGWMPSLVFNSDVELSGVNFIGFADIQVKSGKKNKCLIKDCTFKNTLGDALSITKEGGEGVREAVITDCTFEECSIQTGYMVRLSSDYIGVPCILMKNCTLVRYPLNYASYKNPFGVIKVNGDVLIENNIIYNTCRDHIYCRGGKINVKGNFLYNTDAFNALGDRNLSSDWGQVYCSGFINTTEEALSNTSHKTVVESNLLYGAFAYGGDARGVFIDDGRGDVDCNNNVIINTQIYSIDARNVTKHKASSVRNKYIGNIATKGYRLLPGEAVVDENAPYASGNYLISADKASIIKNTNIDKEDINEEIKVDGSIQNGYLYVSKPFYKRLKKTASWRVVKKYLRYN